MRRFQFIRASAKLSRARVAAEHLERAQTHSLSRPRPAPETPLHPPSRGHPRAGHVRVRARFVVRKRSLGVFVRLRGASRLGFFRLVAESAHFFTNPSLVLPLFRSPIADRRVRRASRGVGFELFVFDTAHADRRDRRARAPGQQRRARRAQASVRGRARAREIAVARAIALERRRRLRGLRARARSRERRIIIPVSNARMSNAQDFGEVLRRRRRDEGRDRGGAPVGAVDPRALLPRLAFRHRDVTPSREHLGAGSSASSEWNTLFAVGTKIPLAKRRVFTCHSQ